MDDFIRALIEGISSPATDIADKLIIGGSGTGAVSFSSTHAQDVINLIGCIGLGLALIGFLTEINQKMAFEGGVNLKSFFAPFLKFGFALIVLLQGGKIISYAAEINNGLVGSMKTIADDIGTANYGEFEDCILLLGEKSQDFGILLLIGMLLPLLFCYVLSMAMNLVYSYKALVYRVEFVWRVALYPLAFADIYSLQHSTAIRYIKGFIAFGFGGAALIYMPSLAASISLSELTNTFKANIDILNGLTDPSILDTAKAFLNCLPSLIEIGFVVPFVGLSGASLARTAAKEALGA